MYEREKRPAEKFMNKKDKISHHKNA